MKLGVREIPERDEVAYYLYRYENPQSKEEHPLAGFLYGFVVGFVTVYCVVAGGGLI